MDSLTGARGQLLRAALAKEGGDINATTEAADVLVTLVEESKGDEGKAERLLGILLDITSWQEPRAEAVKALLGAAVLDVVPRLLGLAAMSPLAAARATWLVEGLLMAGPGPGADAGFGFGASFAVTSHYCSPRELLTAVLEVFDVHKGSAFDTCMHLVLLRLLGGLLPRLIAAVQRRRLQCALSCLQAVADLAAAAGRRMVEYCRMAAAAASGGLCGGGGGTGGSRGEGEEGDGVAARLEAGLGDLARPFVDFAQELYDRVLVTDLPPPQPSANHTADCASTSGESQATNPSSQPLPLPLPQPRPDIPARDRARVSAWLLALLGALWPAWVPTPGPDDGGVGRAKGPAGGLAAAAATAAAFASPASPPAAVGGLAPQLPWAAGASSGTWAGAASRLVRLVWLYLAPSAAAGGGDGGGRWGAPLAGPSWRELWEAARGAARGDQQQEEEEEAEDLLEVCSDPSLPRFGAATLLWLAAVHGPTAEAPSLTASSTARSVVAASAAAPVVGMSGGLPDAAARGMPPSWVRRAALPPLEAAADPLPDMQVLLSACQALLERGREDNSAVQLRRALQLLAAGCVAVHRQAKAAAAVAAAVEANPTSAVVIGSEAASKFKVVNRTAASGAIAPSDDPWVKTAAKLHGGDRSSGLAPTDLYDILAAEQPRLTDAEAQLLPLSRYLATAAMMNVSYSANPAAAATGGSAGEETRSLAHQALQALLTALSPALRALCLAALSEGPSSEVAALALQRLQREVAAADTFAGVALSTLAALQTAPPGTAVQTACSGGAAASVFTAPGVLRIPLAQLLPLVSPAIAAAAGPAGVAAGSSEAEGHRKRTSAGLTALLVQRADAATAAVSVLRFMALRLRARCGCSRLPSAGAQSPLTCTIAVADRAAAGTEALQLGPAKPATTTTTAAAAVAAAARAVPSATADVDAAGAAAMAARVAVLRAVYNTAVRPLYDVIPGVLCELQREVQLEDGRVKGAGAEGVAGTAPTPDSAAASTAAARSKAAAAAVSGSDRFASNVALVGEAVGALAGVSRLAEVLDCARELFE